jgi:hypothetical protein
MPSVDKDETEAASERFSNRFEHLVSGHRFIPRFSLKGTLHPVHQPIETGFRVHACLLNQPAFGSAAWLHAIQRNQSSIVGPGPDPALGSRGILEWLRLRSRFAFEPVNAP